MAAGGAAFAALAWHPVLAPAARPAAASFDPALVKRGTTLAAFGSCAGCHSAPGRPAFSGGLPVETPFGAIYASNITPDPEAGIGGWTEAAFRRALRDGTPRAVAAAPTPLLYWLRNDLALNGAKYGCGLGQCGACAVIVEGEAVMSCVVPVGALEGKRVTTLEGLGTAAAPGPMQRAFIGEQAAQCGYCIPGMMMKAQALRSAGSDGEASPWRL